MCTILWDFINTYAKLGGVFVGSDNQGGNHQCMSNPCSYAPTDYVGVIQAAGKNMKVRNLWANCEHGTSSGDIVGFRYIQFENPIENNIDFKLSSNVDTQCDEYVLKKSLSTYVLLVPAKKHQQLSAHIQQQPWVDSNFLQFGICDQISRPSINSIVHLHHVSTNATFSGNPAPIQICLRFDFCKLSGFSYSNTKHLKQIVETVSTKRKHGEFLGSSHSYLATEDLLGISLDLDNSPTDKELAESQEKLYNSIERLNRLNRGVLETPFTLPLRNAEPDEQIDHLFEVIPLTRWKKQSKTT